MNTQIVPQKDTPSALHTIGKEANGFVAKHAFKKYREGLTKNTRNAHDNDLKHFARFLNALQVYSQERLAELEIETLDDDVLHKTPRAWSVVTYGLVEMFQDSLLQEGYAIRSINRMISTVKKYAALAFKAGHISELEHLRIRQVTGYTGGKAENQDDSRKKAGIPTRRPGPGKKGDGAKKAHWTRLTDEQARALKYDHEDTPQGRRDKVLMSLLLNHGLRVSEIAALSVGDIDLQAGTMYVYRRKTKFDQTLELTPNTLEALRAYARTNREGFRDMPAESTDKLLRGSHKSGILLSKGMSERAIGSHVRRLGQRVGVDKLSPHDCRHYWTTYHANNGDVSTRDIQDAGGWKGSKMVDEYRDRSKVVKSLGDTDQTTNSA